MRSPAVRRCLPDLVLFVGSRRAGPDVVVLVYAAAIAKGRPRIDISFPCRPPPLLHLIPRRHVAGRDPTPSWTRNSSPLHRIEFDADPSFRRNAFARNSEIVTEIAPVLLDNLHDSIQVRRRHDLQTGVSRRAQGIDVRRALGRIVEGGVSTSPLLE